MVRETGVLAIGSRKDTRRESSRRAIKKTRHKSKKTRHMGPETDKVNKENMS